VGILTYDDVADIVRQETTEDIERMAAVAARADARRRTSRRRRCEHFNRRVYWVVGLAMAELLGGRGGAPGSRG
jgi:Mg/Co/Ni transporter MgtE